MKALSIAMFMDVIFALGIREKARRCVEASTIAMFMSIFKEVAFCSQAVRAMRAPVRVS